MNDQLQAQVTTILKQFSDGLSTVGDVAIKELPEIAQQYIAYGFWKGILGISISGSFLIASIVAFFMILRWGKKCHGDGSVFLVLVFPITGIIFSLGVLYSNLENLILNLNAPKLWLLLEIKNMIS